MPLPYLKTFTVVAETSRCRSCKSQTNGNSREEGEARLGALVGALLADGRSEDVAAAVEDKVRREELYAELGI